MSVRLFEGKEHALCYWKYRISPSQEIIDKMLNFLEEHRSRPFGLAVDVGCGSGQGTVLLAPHFSQVVGTDVSPAQLEMAREHSTAQNITYRECQAEQLPFEGSSVDLVTCMSAFHWFEQERFLQEVDRVLRPGGCLALLNYTMDMQLSYADRSDALNRICAELYDAIRPYRHSKLGVCSKGHYQKAHADLRYPAKEWHENLWAKKSIPLSSFIGLIESFSPYQAMMREDPEKARTLSRDFTHRLLTAMGVTSAETEVILSARYYCLLARKS